jgi:hypothetical protein
VLLRALGADDASAEADIDAGGDVDEDSEVEIV